MESGEQQAYIITGTSRGLGKALAKSALKSGAWVVGLNRTEPRDGDVDQAKNGKDWARYAHFFVDLSDPFRVEQAVENAMKFLQDRSIERLILVLNAATEGPTGALVHLSTPDVVASLNVNLVSNLLLISSFKRRIKDFPSKVVIMFISSGVTTVHIPGLEIYSVAKKSMEYVIEMYFKDDQYFDPDKETTISYQIIYPGIVDTDMQKRIRSPESRLPESTKNIFTEYNSQKRLVQASQVADKILKVSKEKGNQSFVRLSVEP